MTPAVLLVRKRGIAHEMLSYTHDPSIRSYGLEAVEALGLDPASVFKTLIVEVAGVGLACAVVPVAHTLDLKAMADAVGGRRARMAQVQAAERSTGYVHGGISPIAQKRMLPTRIDESARGQHRIHVSAGRRGLELVLSPDDLLSVTRGEYARISKS